jgi:putative transposase
MGRENKSVHARALSVSRAHIYYKHKQPDKDWKLKCDIEAVLREHPSYGHKRLALALKRNKKAILRVMKLFGVKPYRRRKSKKYSKNKQKPDEQIFENLLTSNCPIYPHHTWTSDFTHIVWKGKWIYIATLLDLYTREIVGFSVMTNHSRELVINALLGAVTKHSRPIILHSDRGSEYKSHDYTTLCKKLGITQSMSHAGCPWENGYQESFYDKFKIDLGDPGRYDTMGELIYAIYKTIFIYNNSRIHTALKMAPTAFARQYELVNSSSDKVS